jgi:hypothetical protein
MPLLWLGCDDVRGDEHVLSTWTAAIFLDALNIKFVIHFYIFSAFKKKVYSLYVGLRPLR